MSSSTGFDVYLRFDLRREGLIREDPDHSDANTPSSLADAREIAAIHHEMDAKLSESSLRFILAQSNWFKRKWTFCILAFVFVLIPLNLFLMLRAAKTNHLVLFLLSMLLLALTLIWIFYQEYYFHFLVHAFLAWTSKSVIRLRQYALTEFHQHSKVIHTQNALRAGISYQHKHEVYEFIAHSYDSKEDESKQLELDDKQQQTYTFYYRFNENYIVPTLYESFDIDALRNNKRKGFQYYHEWNSLLQEFAIVLDKFQEQFVSAQQQTMHAHDLEMDVAERKVFHSSNSRMRIQLVHEYRLNKIRQSALKQMRRMFTVFGVCLVIGVPLIVNDDHESMASYQNVATWVLIEGIAFFLFTLLTMPLCCGLYQNTKWCCFCCKRAPLMHGRIYSGGDEHEEQLVVKDDSDDEQEQKVGGIVDIKDEENRKLLCCGNSSLWIDCIVAELDDFCEALNVKHEKQYTFRNETGFFEAPNGEPYTGKITVYSC